MENKTFNLVNWEEGMSLTPDSFKMTENYLSTDSVSDRKYISLTLITVFSDR